MAEAGEVELGGLALSGFEKSEEAVTRERGGRQKMREKILKINK